MIAGFIGATISLLAAIFICVIARILCTASACGPSEGVTCPPKISKQYNTNTERKIPILHANLFCTAPTRKGCFFFRNNLTIDQNTANLGPNNTLNKKSTIIILIITSGISYSARKSTRKNENNHITSATPVAIRTSCSFTKPYLSVFCESVG